MSRPRSPASRLEDYVMQKLACCSPTCGLDGTALRALFQLSPPGPVIKNGCACCYDQTQLLGPFMSLL